MKITIVLGAFFPVPPIRGGAVEKAWFALAKEFAKQGHEVTMISRAVPQLPAQEQADGIDHVRIRGFDAPGSLMWLKVLDLIYSVRAIAALSPADIVVTNTFWLPILLGGGAGKIYVHVARYPKGQIRFYSKAARLQSPSGAIARAIEEEAPRLKDRVKTIPYPAPQAAISAIPISERPKTILFVGRVHPEKGIHLLVEAFAGLPSEIRQEWELSIVGPTDQNLGGGGEEYLDDLKRLAKPLAGRVRFQGPVFEPAALERQFLSARLFVYPSLAERGESFGLAPLEAMAHGCAVMVSNLECFSDFIRDGETGFIFDHREQPVAKLRDKLAKAIRDENTLVQIAENGLRKSSEYSVDRVANRFLHDFSSLLA